MSHVFALPIEIICYLSKQTGIMVRIQALFFVFGVAWLNLPPHTFRAKLKSVDIIIVDI